MSKRKKGPARKYIHMASQARKERNSQLYILIVAVLICVAAWIFVSFSGINDHTIVGSVLIFGVCFVLVVIVGLIGNKMAKCNTEYKKLKDMYGITNEMVKEFDKSNR